MEIAAYGQWEVKLMKVMRLMIVVAIGVKCTMVVVHLGAWQAGVLPRSYWWRKPFANWHMQ